MAKHPMMVALDWYGSFSRPPLEDTLYAKQLKGVLLALIRLHRGKKMPWKVRLYVLVHGQIPLSYLENFDAQD